MKDPYEPDDGKPVPLALLILSALISITTLLIFVLAKT